MCLPDLIWSLFFVISLFKNITTSILINTNPPYCTIFEISVFDNFVLADGLFAKALRSLDTCASVNNNLCGKLASSLESPITFDERFEIASVPSLIVESNLLSWKLENVTFKLLYWVTFYWYYIKSK